MTTPRIPSSLFQLRNTVLLILLLVIFVLSRSWAVGQSASATLSGTVEDQSGAVIPNASVTIENVGTSLRRQTTTNGNGHFTLPLLPPATYTLRIDSQGFSPVQVNDVVLNVGDNKALQIQLKAGDVNAQVTIDSDAETVRTDGSVGTVVNRQFVANMPLNGRSLQALIQLTPGVVLTANDAASGTSGGQFSVNGQRTTSNYFTVDGVGANTGMVTTRLSGTTGQAGFGTGIGATALGGTNSLVSLDALQEFRIETSSYAAEFGRASGGQVSLVTRSGTNDVTGSVSYYFRNEALDANNWFANANRQPKPKERQSLFSGVLGGPIYLPRFGEGGPGLWSGKDRLFFFFSYEGLRLQQPQSKVTLVPSASIRTAPTTPAILKPFLSASPLPNGQDFGNGSAQLAASYSDPANFNIFGLRIDGNITKSLTGFFRFNHAPSEAAQRGTNISSILHTNTLNDTYTGGVTWLVSKELTADLRANWTSNVVKSFLDLDNFGGAIIPRAEDIFIPGRNPTNSTVVFSGPTRTTGVWSWGTGAKNVQRQFNIVGTGSYLTGAHQLKFGVDYRRLLPVFADDGTGSNFENIQFFSVAGINSLTALLYQISSSVPNRREAIVPALSLFAQDTWRTTSRLTLTYGLRFERVPSPGEATGQFPQVLLGLEVDPPQNVQIAPKGTPLFHTRLGFFAPRFGAAYQLSRNTGWETTLRAGVGQFYDIALGSIAEAFQLSWPFYVSTTRFNVPFSLANRTPPVPGTDVPSSFTQLDPKLKLPYTLQWNTAWEQAIGKSQTLTATYVGASGRRLLGYEQNVVPSPFKAGATLFLNVGRNLSRSRYDALQLQYNRRLSRRLQALASYTLGSSRDTLSSNIANLTPLINPAGPLVPEWGPSNFDVRHIFSSAVSYDLPRLTKTSVLSQLVNWWGADLLVRYQSAPPYNPTVDNFLVVQGATFNSVQPNLISGVPVYVNDPTAPGGRRLNIAVPTGAQIVSAGCDPLGVAKGAFCTPPTGQQGNFQRNGLRAFDAMQVDLAVRRQFNLGEKLKLQLRAELFNIFNHPNFSGVSKVLGNGDFGLATQTLNASLGGLNALYQMGGPRSGQLSLKVLW